MLVLTVCVCDSVCKDHVSDSDGESDSESGGGSSASLELQ